MGPRVPVPMALCSGGVGVNRREWENKDKRGEICEEVCREIVGESRLGGRDTAVRAWPVWHTIRVPNGGRRPVRGRCAALRAIGMWAMAGVVREIGPCGSGRAYEGSMSYGKCSGDGATSRRPDGRGFWCGGAVRPLRLGEIRSLPATIPTDWLPVQLAGT